MRLYVSYIRQDDGYLSDWRLSVSYMTQYEHYLSAQLTDNRHSASCKRQMTIILTHVADS
jgi:hypothetical protein